MRGPAIGATALVLALMPADAEERRPHYFPRGEETCFARTYDAAHLRAHPKQTVTSFYLWHELTPDPLREYEDETADEKRAFDQDPNNRLYLTLFLHRTNREGMQIQTFECGSADGKEMGCGIDCDGGSFTGKRHDQGSLLITNQGFQLEGVCDGGMDYLAPGEDDKIFRLDPLPASACLAERDGGRPSLAEAGPPLREKLDGDGTACYQRTYTAAEMTRDQTVSAIWLSKNGVDFFIGVRLGDGTRAEAKADCGPNTYSWACFNPNHQDIDYYGPNKSLGQESPAATLVRAGADTLKLFNHRNNLAKLLGLKLGAGDDVFRMRLAETAACGKE